VFRRRDGYLPRFDSVRDSHCRLRNSRGLTNVAFMQSWHAARGSRGFHSWVHPFAALGAVHTVAQFALFDKSIPSRWSEEVGRVNIRRLFPVNLGRGSAT
jgi:hypothetical protein